MIKSATNTNNKTLQRLNFSLHLFVEKGTGVHRSRIFSSWKICVFGCYSCTCNAWRDKLSVVIKPNINHNSLNITVFFMTGWCEISILSFCRFVFFIFLSFCLFIFLYFCLFVLFLLPFCKNRWKIQISTQISLRRTQKNQCWRIRVLKAAVCVLHFPNFLPIWNPFEFTQAVWQIVSNPHWGGKQELWYVMY